MNNKGYAIIDGIMDCIWGVIFAIVDVVMNNIAATADTTPTLRSE